MRSFRTASTLLATALLSLGTLGTLGACSDPELASDLQTEGDPHVVEVNVFSEGSVFGLTDPSGFGLLLGEAATFCRPGSEFKVNTSYCPEARNDIGEPQRGEREVAPITDTLPYSQQFGSATFWHVRIIFDELLDPDVEDLITDDEGEVIGGTIADTQPVTLTCGGVDVAYDGFYDPSGNWLTFPPGPALVIQALDFVASSTQDCEVSINSGAVTDKDGNEVPSDELGPYTFGIAPMTLYGTDPAVTGPLSDEEFADTEADFATCEPVPTNATEAEQCLATTGVDPTGAVTISFAAPVDIATVAPHITFEDADGTPVPFTVTEVDPLDPDMTPVPEQDRITAFIVPDDPLADETFYVVTITSAEGDAITDIAGGELILFDPQSGEVTDTNTIWFETGTAE
jgi:hypothetical protein